MVGYDEDDDPPGGRRRDDSVDDGPSGPDISDEDGGAACVHCGRTIHGNADLCPYCKQWQTGDDVPERKPRWFVLTVVFCLAALSGLLAMVLVYRGGR